MLTGVIYGAIVVAWAAYLVPLALRRHDAASRSRSIDRFSSAMKILARRGAAAPVLGETSRLVITPNRGERAVVPPEPERESERVLVEPTRNRAAERAAAAKRRRVLSLISGMCIGVALVALLGWTPKWIVAVPVALLVGFLVAARLSVRRATKPRWVEVPTAEQTPGVVVRRSPVRVEASLGSDVDPADIPADTSVDEPAIPAAPPAKAKPASAAVSSMPATSIRTPDGGSLWDPLPVTLPSYVGAPTAVRTIRTIELGEPGTRTSVREPARAAAGPEGQDDEETVEIRRVVNG